MNPMQDIALAVCLEGRLQSQLRYVGSSLKGG